MCTLNLVGTFRIDYPENTYIYQIEPIADNIASISSDDCLRLVDPHALHRLPLCVMENVHEKVTCLKVVDGQIGVVCTAGRDGIINTFDFRTKVKVAELLYGEGILN